MSILFMGLLIFVIFCGMKRGIFHWVHLRVVLLGLILAGSASALEAQPASYAHPMYEMRFTASSNWVKELHENNGQVLRVVHPNRNLQVFLSYLSGCGRPEQQLKEISGQRGLICQDQSFDTVLNGRKALLMRGVCVQGKRPYRRMITGIQGKEGLYIMEICCPEECFASHREEMEAILGSLEVGS
jgi:hypothetical protein